MPFIDPPHASGESLPLRCQVAVGAFRFGYAGQGEYVYVIGHLAHCHRCFELFAEGIAAELA